MVNAGRVLLVTTIIGAGLLGFGILQLNVDLSAIGFTLASVTGANVTQAIPLVDESSPVLLRTKDFVSPSNVIESAPRFAVAERFAPQNATVITEFTMQLATEDPNVTVTGYVWDDSGTLPIRLVSSTETFNGTDIGTVLSDVTFTFPRAVVLEPTEFFDCPDFVGIACGQPFIRNYAVGIRVDQNLAGSFTYGFINVTVPTDPFPIGFHQKVIDLDVTIDGETVFLFTPICIQIFPLPLACQEGMIGIDILHDPALAQSLQETTDEIIDIIMNQTDIVTPEQELTACIAIFPPPPECTGDDPLAPLECGIAEELNLSQNVCLCKEGFTRQFVPLLSPIQEGTFECLPELTIPIPPPLQIQPRVDPIVFIGAGGVILVGSLIGIGVRSIRK